MPKIKLKPLEREAKFHRLLGDENRLKIVLQLYAGGPSNVGSIAKAVGQSQSRTSQLLKMMKDAGIMTHRREAQFIFYEIAPEWAEAVLQVYQRCQRGGGVQQDDRPEDVQRDDPPSDT